jgi:hypothetical protein
MLNFGPNFGPVLKSSGSNLGSELNRDIATQKGLLSIYPPLLGRLTHVIPSPANQTKSRGMQYFRSTSLWWKYGRWHILYAPFPTYSTVWWCNGYCCIWYVTYVWHLPQFEGSILMMCIFFYFLLFYFLLLLFYCFLFFIHNESPLMSPLDPVYIFTFTFLHGVPKL